MNDGNAFLESGSSPPTHLHVEVKIYNNPEFTADETHPSYQACGETLWSLALSVARKFSGFVTETVHGHSREDLAMAGVLHVLVQAKRGRLDRVPSAERWNVIYRILWNRVIDESRRFSNKYELQSPTIVDGDGQEMDSDQALELVAADKDLAFRTGCPVPRRELRLLETMLDSALAALPNQESLFVKLRFGLCRNDELVGDEDAITFLDAMTLDDLADIGYGSDRSAVKKRLDKALEQVRSHILADLKRCKIVNFRV